MSAIRRQRYADHPTLPSARTRRHPWGIACVDARIVANAAAPTIAFGDISLVGAVALEAFMRQGQSRRGPPDSA